jgi:hypothetical protein
MSILIWIIPLGVFIFCIAYVCGYIYGTKHGIDFGIEMAIDRAVGNLRQAANELDMDEVFNKILVRGNEIVERKHD